MWRFSRRREALCLLLAVAFVAIVGRYMPEGRQREGQQQCQLGPLSLGMSLKEAQRTFRTPGFPGLRDTVPGVTGRSFINSSSQVVAGAVFKLPGERLVSMNISSRLEEIKAAETGARLLGFRDWISQADFENWSTSQGFRLGDSRETVLRLCRLDPVVGAKNARRLLIEYQANLPTFSHSEDAVREFPEERDTLKVTVLEEAKAIPYLLDVQFQEGLVVSICVSTKR